MTRMNRMKIRTTTPATPIPELETVVNPVLETFKQLPGTGCLACHTGATVAAVGKDVKNYATSYSFMFGHATAPPK